MTWSIPWSHRSARAINRTGGDFLAIGAGKYMGFDGADSPFHGRGGHTTFLHLAFNGTPTHGRLVPSVFTAESQQQYARLGWEKGSEPWSGEAAVHGRSVHPSSPEFSHLNTVDATINRNGTGQSFGETTASN
jgi:hypothetical protein